MHLRVIVALAVQKNKEKKRSDFHRNGELLMLWKVAAELNEEYEGD